MNRHYTEQHLADIKKATSFADLVLIALDSLSKIPSDNIVQICGPISTGKHPVPKNIQIFKKTIDVFVKNDKTIFNQLVFGEQMGVLKTKWHETHSKPAHEYCMPILEEFYLPVFQSGLIKTFYFIPGWKHSVGTRWEYAQADILGIKKVFLPNNWSSHFKIHKRVLEL